jgi:hypothetical protein
VGLGQRDRARRVGCRQVSENSEESENHAALRGTDLEWVREYEEWAREDDKAALFRRAALTAAAERWRDE